MIFHLASSTAVIVSVGTSYFEVWADEDGQHGIVETFDSARDAARFAVKHYPKPLR